MTIEDIYDQWDNEQDNTCSSCLIETCEFCDEYRKEISGYDSFENGGNDDE